MEEFAPDVLLTYGGHWVTREIVKRARRRGVAAVFWLRNCGYSRPETFKGVNRIIVPSRFAADYYKKLLGLDCVVIPTPLVAERVARTDVGERHVTFVNPTPEKGTYVFTRIAAMLARGRPDIPLLVVEGRGRGEELTRAGLRVERIPWLRVMENVPDPRAFYRLSHVVLFPSVGPETFGRVPAEAMANGIPVLGSNRGGIPELLREAGFVLDIPEKYTARTKIVPTREEMTPWVETIVRLWDDERFYNEQSRRCLAAAEAFAWDRLLPRDEDALREAMGRGQ